MVVRIKGVVIVGKFMALRLVSCFFFNLFFLLFLVEEELRVSHSLISQVTCQTLVVSSTATLMLWSSVVALSLQKYDAPSLQI